MRWLIPVDKNLEMTKVDETFRILRIPGVQIPQGAPDWLKVRLPAGEQYFRLKIWSGNSRLHDCIVRMRGVANIGRVRGAEGPRHFIDLGVLHPGVADSVPSKPAGRRFMTLEEPGAGRSRPEPSSQIRGHHISGPDDWRTVEPLFR